MKKILAVCLVTILLLTLCACGEDQDKPTTAPTRKPVAATTTIPTTGSAAPTTQPTTAPTTAPTTDPNAMTEDKALEIGRELLGKYNWYGAVGACCEMEYVEGDMSAYLSDEQKDVYVGSQQRITCCENAEAVISHLHHTFSDRLITYYPEDLLFTDDAGNLYIIIYPTGLPSYQNHRVLSFSESFITMEADCYEEDSLKGTARIDCVLTFDGFILETFTFTETHQGALTEDAALYVATQLLEEYAWFQAIGVCCESEYVEEDMSAFLSDAQKESYSGSQRRICCCGSKAEVSAHIASRFAQNLVVQGNLDDLLFSDDEGNLYVIIWPSEVANYQNHRVVFFDDDTIIMEADDWYEELVGTVRVVCTRSDDGFILEQFTYNTPEY